MPRKFSKGQVAPMEREGRTEFKNKKRSKPVAPKVKKSPMPPTGGLAIGM
jgi:hypothetical protein